MLLAPDAHRSGRDEGARKRIRRDLGRGRRRRAGRARRRDREGRGSACEARRRWGGMGPGRESQQRAGAHHHNQADQSQPHEDRRPATVEAGCCMAIAGRIARPRTIARHWRVRCWCGVGRRLGRGLRPAVSRRWSRSRCDWLRQDRGIRGRTLRLRRQDRRSRWSRCPRRHRRRRVQELPAYRTEPAAGRELATAAEARCCSRACVLTHGALPRCRTEVGGRRRRAESMPCWESMPARQPPLSLAIGPPGYRSMVSSLCSLGWPAEA